MNPTPETDVFMGADSTLSTFIASDGDNIAVQDWPLAQAHQLRGVVILVHGLGEHAGRYDHVARRLNEWGFAVRGFDQYGHGESGGKRGGLTSDDRLLDDLGDIVESTRKRMPKACPLIVIGHSMGGLVAALFILQNAKKVDALVMTSPALDPGLDALQKLLLSVLPKIAPNMRVGNGLDVSKISHDLNVVQAYKNDKLVHDRISARLAKFIADGGVTVLAAAPQWKIPTLLMFAGQDKLVDPAGSRAFAAAAPVSVVTSHCFDALYHEIFNELEAGPVFAKLKTWLDGKF
jgi:alpha-beta hydrolase superfamily lysophospholipase